MLCFAFVFVPRTLHGEGGVSSSSPDFYEATGRRSSSDNGNDLTTDTDSFMIGNRVYVGGVKSGRITFIGEVHFAPGEWAGVVLDEPEENLGKVKIIAGKNDGAVSGKRYFQCEPKKGIFSRLTRLTREPLGSAALSDGTYSMETSFRSMTSPARSGTTSPTYSMSSAAKSPLGTRISSDLEVNDRVIVKSATGSRVGVLRYIGTPLFASGVWCGVEFDEPVGKNDGTVSNHRYFKCAPNHGLFVPQSKVSLSPLARKNRLSRANSQESLASNLTLGSSTTTSKLRSDAIQKRMSLHKTSTAATSTPKPLYSLQDILREKTNHIEQLMNEREKDRDEMAAQGVLFNKNISLGSPLL
ncbi:CLUMA_CG001920, isoform A [Clunio marinus]|uniref:CLUMA_CG001920, isoform A n=1 Tax=Clunio marinus TaxID=568069 RepID=A0A1J1HJC9_9DIPT|nr:CLUMA_CG001920, isoform A [Clunio marinus]